MSPADFSCVVTEAGNNHIINSPESSCKYSVGGASLAKRAHQAAANSLPPRGMVWGREEKRSRLWTVYA